MGYENYNATRPGPCAMCEKPEGGFMGSSRWLHDAMCCSDACGLAYAESPRRALAELERIDGEMRALRQERKHWKRLAPTVGDDA